MSPIILHLTRRSTFASHSGEPQEYCTLKRQYFWPIISGDVYSKVRHYQIFPQMRTKFKRHRQLQLFSRSDRLELIANDFHGLLPRTRSDSQLVIIITDRYSKMTHAILTTKILSTHVAEIIPDNCFMPYLIPDIILSDNGQHVLSKIFI